MLDVEKVNAYYSQFQAIKDVSIRVEDGELVSIFGPNGHGKSTLLKAICGLLPIASGCVKWNGENITKLSSLELVEMGIVYIAEDRHLFPQMTVKGNLLLGAYNKNARKKERGNLEYVFSLFPRLYEWQQRKAETLSGGEARMLAIGRGLMSNAKFLAIDEPSFGLAPHLRKEVFHKIGEINKSGIGVLLVEQNVAESSYLANRIYLLEDGNIVYEGNRDEAMNDEHVKKIYLGV